MTNHTQQYRLSEAVDQKRLEELSDRDAQSVSDVSGEIGLARFLAERSATTNPGLCAAILNVISQIVDCGRAPRRSHERTAGAGRRFGRSCRRSSPSYARSCNSCPIRELHIENIARRIDAAFAEGEERTRRGTQVALLRKEPPMNLMKLISEETAAKEPLLILDKPRLSRSRQRRLAPRPDARSSRA